MTPDFQFLFEGLFYRLRKSFLFAPPQRFRSILSIIKANRHYGAADGLSRIGIRQSVAIPEHEKHLIAFDDTVHKPEAIILHELTGSGL